MLDLGTSILNSVERIPNASAITNKNKTLSYIEWFSIIEIGRASCRERV